MAFPLLDPDARKNLELKNFPGVKFSLRTIPFGRWLFLRNSLLLTMEAAERRAVAELKAAGLDPEADPRKADDPSREKGPLSNKALRVNLDPVGESELFALNSEIVRWGLADVEGLELRGGPFKPAKEIAQHEGEGYEVLTKAAVRVLAAQRGLVISVANEIWLLNELGDEAKKS